MTKRINRTWFIGLECVGMQFRWKMSGRETLARNVPFLVDLKREPDNPDDENAIQVVIASDFKLKALRGQQLGYLRRKTAAMLAPKLDNGSMEVVNIWVSEVDPSNGIAFLDCRFRDLPKSKRRTAQQIAGDEAHSPGSDSSV